MFVCRRHSQLKTIDDSLKIRRRILTNLEIASLPSTSPEQREKLLNFVVCGGGPTGVEFASELYDMISEDVMGECGRKGARSPFCAAVI